MSFPESSAARLIEIAFVMIFPDDTAAKAAAEAKLAALGLTPEEIAGLSK